MPRGSAGIMQRTHRYWHCRRPFVYSVAAPSVVRIASLFPGEASGMSCTSARPSPKESVPCDHRLRRGSPVRPAAAARFSSAPREDNCPRRMYTRGRRILVRELVDERCGGPEGRRTVGPTLEKVVDVNFRSRRCLTLTHRRMRRGQVSSVEKFWSRKIPEAVGDQVAS